MKAIDVKVIAKAGFEAGIKLGAIFHQFVGMPVSEKNASRVEKTIESCVELQPFVEKVEVKIDRKMLKKNLSRFDYTSLLPEMLKARVEVRYENCRVRAKLEWEKDYPMMSIEEVEFL